MSILDRTLIIADFLCDPGGIRTHDPQLRRLLLYPAELRDHALKVGKISNFLRA